jgi:mRNA deadenylase 3'-5' endonuclease subunit Ccr4
LELNNAYTDNTEPTNFKENFTDTLDYIFHSKSLHLSSLMNHGFTGPLPNEHHPSDHAPLWAEFSI